MLRLDGLAQVVNEQIQGAELVGLPHRRLRPVLEGVPHRHFQGVVLAHDEFRYFFSLEEAHNVGVRQFLPGRHVVQGRDG